MAILRLSIQRIGIAQTISQPLQIHNLHADIAELLLQVGDAFFNSARLGFGYDAIGDGVLMRLAANSIFSFVSLPISLVPRPPINLTICSGNCFNAAFSVASL